MIADRIIQTLALPRLRLPGRHPSHDVLLSSAGGRLGTLSEGLRTPSSARRQHALLGYCWRNNRCGRCANFTATQSRTRLRVAMRIGAFLPGDPVAAVRACHNRWNEAGASTVPCTARVVVTRAVFRGPWSEITEVRHAVSIGIQVVVSAWAYVSIIRHAVAVAVICFAARVQFLNFR
jgi:hypothetical protein